MLDFIKNNKKIFLVLTIIVLFPFICFIMSELISVILNLGRLIGSALYQINHVC